MSEPLSPEDARHALYRIMDDEQASFEEKAERALSLGRRYLGVENGHLTRIDTDSDYWKAITSTDPPGGQFPPDLVLDLGTTYCRRTVEAGPVTLHHASEQGWDGDQAYAAHELETYHGTTLIVDEEPYGTVCFVDNEPRGEPFSEEETMFAELVSRMLEHELRHQRTREQVERLDQFASIVSHDLRNPLGIAQGNIDLAREQQGDSEALATASRALDRMENLIDDVLAIARQSQDVTETGVVSLESVVESCWTTVDTSEATLDIASDCALQADPQRFQQLVENLFRNAVEHGGSDVTVEVGALPDADGFYVEDSGPGIPEDSRDDIFQTGFSESEDGLGLGLAIVDGVVSAHGWAITVTEGERGGARFEISDVVIG